MNQKDKEVMPEMYQATPHDVLITEIMDCMVPKTEREHAAAKEIKALRESIKAAVLAEREACAKVCDAEATIEGIAQKCAAAIRARGEK